MARGGRRKGVQGKPYPNRTDLRGPGTPDIPKTMTGQPYGVAKQQAEMQASAPAGPAAAPTGPGAPPVAPQTAGAAGPPPGGLGAFNRPTEAPNEPLTAGLSTGPGPGREALGIDRPSDVDIRDMAVYLPALEILASMPSASMATKTFVRRLRGMVPPNHMRNQGI